MELEVTDVADGMGMEVEETKGRWKILIAWKAVLTSGDNREKIRDKISTFIELHSSEESESKVTQLCPTLCDPTDCNLLGSSVHGIVRARVLEWVAISFSRGSSRPRDQTQVSCI